MTLTSIDLSTAPTTHEGILAFVREVGFGVLAMNGADGPLMAHVPFILNETGDLAELHLVRSNPVARMLKTPQPVRLAVTGPDSYV